MKIKLLIIVIVACCCSKTFAQGNETVIPKQKIATLKNDSFKVKVYITLSETYRNTNNDSAKQFAIKAIDLARQLRLVKLEASAHNSLGFANYYKGDYPAAIQSFQEYFTLAKSMSDKVGMGYARNNEGNVYIELGNYVNALAKYKEALAIRIEAKDNNGIAMSYNNIGFVYKDLGDYDKAIPNFLQSLRINESINNQKSQAICYNFLASVYSRKKDFKLAYQNLDKAIAIQKKLNDNANLAISLHSKGSVFGDEKVYDSTIYYYKLAKIIYEKNDDIRQLALINVDIAALFSKQSQYDSSIHYYKKGINYNNIIGNKRSQAESYTGIANAFLNFASLANCKLYLDSALSILAVTHRKEEYKNYYRTLSDYYKAMGNNDAALTSLEQYILFKDSLLNAESQKSIADLQIKYDVEKKDQQIILQHSEIGKRNILLLSLMALGVLMILLGFLYYNRLKLKQQSKLQNEIMQQQKKATTAIIEAEEKERKRIALDLHDGIGQLMTAAWLNLQAVNATIEDENTQQSQLISKALHLVDESCKEVRAVSHNMMPNALLKKGLVNAVREFIHQINNKNTNINLQTDGLSHPLQSHVETVLYRVIQESVNNVIKHAVASSLDISINQDEEGIDVMIEDNGKGFNITEAEKKDGIGLQNIKSRIQYLKGTVEWSSAENKGTLVAIHIPINID